MDTKFKKLQKVAKHMEKIAKELDLPSGEWKHIGVTCWVKKGKIIKLDGMTVYIDAENQMKRKKWWEFWK